MALRVMFDVTDARALWRLRARVVGGFLIGAALIAGAIRLVFPLAAAAVEDYIFFPVIGGCFAIGVVVLWTGARLGDRAFLLSQMLAVVLASIAMVRFDQGGSPMAWEFVLLPTLINTAVFCVRLRDAVLGAGFAVLMTGVCAYLRLAPAGLGIAGAVIETFAVVVVAVAIRLLRDVAFTALQAAQHGEVSDPMTGLMNRRGFERVGSARWRDRAARGQAACLLVVDIDHFKQVNDTLGHAAGGELIRKIGELLRGSIRDGELAVRAGGEEFVLLIWADPAGGPAVAERLRRKVAEELAPVTVSIGVHPVTPALADGLPERLWEMVEMADEALYEAKHTGRNRVVTTHA